MNQGQPTQTSHPASDKPFRVAMIVSRETINEFPVFLRRLLLGMADESKLGIYHEQQVEEVLKKESNLRESEWTESIAVGSRQFVEKTKIQLGIKVRGRKVTEKNGIYNLKEGQDPYSAVSDPEKVGLSAENSYFWNQYGGITA